MSDRRSRSPAIRGTIQDALINLMAASAYIDSQYEALCASHGITANQLEVLCLLLVAHPHACSTAEIRALWKRRGSDLSRLLDRLERKRLVRRERAPNDRRVAVCRLSEDGLRLLRELDPLVGALHETVARRLSTRRRRQLARLTRRMIG